MTVCTDCGHTFGSFLRRRCPNCGAYFRQGGTAVSRVSEAKKSDDGFDVTGFAVGMATGIPLSPSYGVSVGSMLGAAMHPSPSHASPPRDDSYSGGGGSYGGGGASSSWSDSSSSSSSSDSSSSSSSSSYDSGSSSSSSGSD